VSPPLTFRPQARTELLEARHRYDGHRPGLGTEFALEVDRTISFILRSPASLPRVHGETRRCRVQRFPYAVYYRLLGEEVVVLAVMHGRRNPRRWQSRR
jgi:plasmid stabilization system protein ParE